MILQTDIISNRIVEEYLFDPKHIHVGFSASLDIY